MDAKELSEVISKECAAWGEAETIGQLNEMYENRASLEDIGVPEPARAGVEAARLMAWVAAMQVCIFRVPSEHREFIRSL